MLRLRGATSPVADFTSGRFEPVIDDARITDKAAVKRVLLHSGKIHYDLLSELQKQPNEEIALVRVEQFYPVPAAELNAVVAQYPDAELVWVQDEPENQGAWPFICLEAAKHLEGRTVRNVSRTASASPATGSAKRVVLTSGKIYYDIIAELDKRESSDIAVVRMEQFYPLPVSELNGILKSYPNADLVWTQDEPENQGAWPFMCLELAKHLEGRTLKVASRPASASPATGSTKRSAQEQADLIARALDV